MVFYMDLYRKCDFLCEGCVEFYYDRRRQEMLGIQEIVSIEDYCLTKISIRAKRSFSRVFSLFIVPSPFFVHCPYKGRINRAESVLTRLKPY